MTVVTGLLGYTGVTTNSKVLMALVSLISCLRQNDNNPPHLPQYTTLIVVVFMVEAVLGLMSYVLQDRLEEDLGDKIMARMLENYQHDHLIKESVDKVQIEVER